MKTTKEIAELFSSEIDRIAKGEVRTNIIRGLSECTDQMIKLARLEMDFAFRNWGEQPPNVPWITTKPMVKEIEEPHAIVKTTPLNLNVGTGRNLNHASTSRGQQIEKEIENAQKQLRTATGAMKTILTDKINLLQNKLERAEAQKDSKADNDPSSS